MKKTECHLRSFRNAILLTAALLVTYALCTAAAALHQARALHEAEQASAQGLPAMIRMGHLARCVSLATPFTNALTSRCLKSSYSLISALEAAGRTDGARVSRSALFGALESSLMESDEMAEKKRSLKARIMPAGAAPLPRTAVLAREPWSYLGVMAGMLLMTLATWHLGILPLISIRRRKTGLVRILMGAALAALFIAGLVLA